MFIVEILCTLSVNTSTITVFLQTIISALLKQIHKHIVHFMRTNTCPVLYTFCNVFT